MQGKAITFLSAGISGDNFPQKVRESYFSTFRDERAGLVIPGKYHDGPWYMIYAVKYIYDYDLWFTEENFRKSEKT